MVRPVRREDRRVLTVVNADQIDKVVYAFDIRSGFSPPRSESSNRNDQFRSSYRAIGAPDRDIDIILVLRGGEQITLKFNIFRYFR